MLWSRILETKFFKSDIIQSTNRTWRDWNICAVQFGFSDKEKTKSFVSILEPSTRDSFIDNYETLKLYKLAKQITKEKKVC